ncbi:uncharacterized protein LOC144627433 [Crassostrea virginica]
MPRKRRGAVEDPKAPAGPATSHRKEKPPASRNAGLPQPSQPPPTVQAPPAPQDSHIPQDPPLAQSQVLQAQQSMHNPPPSHTPDLWQNPQPVQGRVLLKVVNPNVDVNVDVDVTFVNFAFYLTTYLTFWHRFTSDSTCAYEHT